MTYGWGDVIDRHVTRNAIVAYIRADTEPRHIRKIEQFMRFHSGVSPSATREALRRLARAGVIVRVESGYWRMAADGEGNLPRATE